MSNINFDEDQYQNRSISDLEPKGITGFFINKGLVKDKNQANILMLILTILIVIITIIIS